MFRGFQRRVLLFLSSQFLRDSQMKRRLALDKLQAALRNRETRKFLVLRVLVPSTCLQLHIKWVWYYRATYFYEHLIVNNIRHRFGG